MNGAELAVNASLQKETYDKQIKDALNGAPSEVHVPTNDPKVRKGEKRYAHGDNIASH